VHFKINKPIMKSYLTTIVLLLSLFNCPSAFAQSKEEIGLAAYYNDKLQNKKTASGEPYDKDKYTGAHKTLPFGTIVRVTRLDTNESVEVKINDRGPYSKGRIIDLSRVAAEQIDLVRAGITKVKIEVIPNDAPPPVPSAAPEKPDGGVVEKPTTPEPPKTPNPEKPKKEKPTETVQGKDFTAYDLYKVQLLRPEKSGFGVQVASLNNYANAMRQIAELQEMWFNNILVSIEPGKNNEPVYKILLGPFPDRETAKSYQNELKNKKNIEGFIIALDAIKY
jgi:rare lipoprotein A